MSKGSQLPKPCLTCGSMFVSKVKGIRSKYCGRSCWPGDLVDHYRSIERRSEQKRKGRTTISKAFKRCCRCGQTFFLKRGLKHHHRLFCYDGCATAKPHGPEPIKQKQMHSVICRGCGLKFSGSRSRKWCSERCRQNQYRSNWTDIAFKNCDNCGKLFCFRITQPTACCSSKCAKRKCEKTRRHRLRSQTEHSDAITVFLLGERDGWRCHLCRKPVPNRSHKGRPLDPEIDHLIPVSEGGAHVWGNVALAHRKCNIARSNTGPAQLRLIA